MEKEHSELQKQIALEEKNFPVLTVPMVHFFLRKLKDGNDLLLSEIEDNSKKAEGLFLDGVAPPETHQNSKRITVGFSIPFLTSKLAMHN